ncbi:MAG: hypothetical protein DSZ24_04245 [Thermodesulfatator sp.]|nr:MAG: hypothetical protein DSZ24_04245 [Thermodesulfatator sp.]
MIKRAQYRFQEGYTPLSADELNRRFFDLDSRLDALERLKVSWEEAVEKVQRLGLERLNQVLLPVIQGVLPKLENFDQYTNWASQIDPDGDGFLTPERILQGSGSLTYDSQGNLQTLTQSFPDGRTLTVQFSYDAEGNLTHLSYVLDGVPLYGLELSYDAEGRLISFSEVTS